MGLVNPSLQASVRHQTKEVMLRWNVLPRLTLDVGAIAANADRDRLVSHDPGTSPGDSPWDVRVGRRGPSQHGRPVRRVH
jgi:hypothetical protein